MRRDQGQIALGIAEGDEGAFDRASGHGGDDGAARRIRRPARAALEGLPDDATLREHLEPLGGPLLHTLLVSEPWDTGSVGGEEVDVDWLLDGPPPAQSLANAPAVI